MKKRKEKKRISTFPENVQYFLGLPQTVLQDIKQSLEYVHLVMNGILLYSEEKQQDFFGCLARFLGCPGLREADNPEI